MGMDVELDIENTLRDALELVLGTLPVSVGPIEVLAAYILSLVKDFGLAESQHVDPFEYERPEPPAPVRLLVGEYLPLDDDSLRDRLYDLFVALAGDQSVGKTINHNAPLGPERVLLLAQTAWNIERNERRPLLPLRQGEITLDGIRVQADIAEPATGKDFARMTWTKRSNLKGVPGRSSGDGFRKQTARLAVLVATHLVGEIPLAPELADANLEISTDGRRTIIWRTPRIDSPAPPASVLPRTSPVLIGNPPELGDLYEPRSFDADIERMWSDGGNRRVWLRGGPGLGKTFAARRLMQGALAERGDKRDELLIWVDSADAASVAREFALAAERMPGFGLTLATDAANREERLARMMLNWLRTTETRWLVILDDARADELIRQQLLPPGTNTHGRVLITTLGGFDGDAAGRQILAEQFSPMEAERYLSARLIKSSAEERANLAEKVGHHPLVLAMGTATILAERMPIADWLSEFDAMRLDDAVDHSDVGGYPHPITATWRVALTKAAQGFAEGMVERAAMVAALQDPDGHPTWLWHTGAVRDWVDGASSSPRSSRRMHSAVRRLVEFGVLEIHGDWSGGRIAIHQMAARAVREAADTTLLTEIAAILAKEWTLRLTSDPERVRPEDVEAGVRPLRALPGVDSFTSDALHALAEFAQPALNATLLHWSRDELKVLEPLFLRGGAIGRAELAERRAELGQAERAHGLELEARVNLNAALEIYALLIKDRSLDDESHAEFLESMAEVETALDQSDSAREHRQDAIRIRERVETATPDPDRSLSNLIALTDLHQELADDRRSQDILDRALALKARQSSTDTDDAAAEHTQLARRLAVHGRLDEAIEHMRRAADLSAQTEFGRIVRLKPIGRQLASLYGRVGRWKKAERWMKRSDGDPLLLASIQLHRNRIDAAEKSLTRAARSISRPAAAEAASASIPPVIREARDDFVDLEIADLIRKAFRRRRWDDAADLAAISLERVRDRADASPGEDPARLAREYVSTGVIANRAGRHEEAVAFLTSGVTIFEMLSQIQPDDDSGRKLADSLVWLARAHIGAGAFEQAVVGARRAVGVLDGLDVDESRTELGSALYVLADALEEAGDIDEALEVHRRRVGILEAEATPGSVDRNALGALGDALSTLTMTCIVNRRWSDALEPATELLRVREALVDGALENSESQVDLAKACFALGQIHSNLDQPAESETLARRAAVTLRNRLRCDPDFTGAQAELAYSLALHADSLDKLNRDEEAIVALIEAVNILQLPAELSPEEHGELQVGLLRQLAGALRERGRSGEADEVSERADVLEKGLRAPEDD